MKSPSRQLAAHRPNRRGVPSGKIQSGKWLGLPNLTRYRNSRSPLQWEPLIRSSASRRSQLFQYLVRFSHLAETACARRLLYSKQRYPCKRFTPHPSSVGALGSSGVYLELGSFGKSNQPLPRLGPRPRGCPSNSMINKGLGEIGFVWSHPSVAARSPRNWLRLVKRLPAFQCPPSPTRNPRP